MVNLKKKMLWDGSYINSKDFFDYLMWFHKEPQNLLNVFYRTELESITKNQKL